MNPIRVLLADDHSLVRAGFRSLLEKLPDIECVAEASDGRQALDLLPKCNPDVVLMDIGMPLLNGLEATLRIQQEFPTVRVLMLSMHSQEAYVCRALRAGAKGYLVKDADVAEVAVAVRAVARGEMYLTPSVSRTLLEDYLRRHPAEDNVSDSLTPRQKEILQLIAEGKSVKQISTILLISVKTVETHKAHLMERLNIHDVAGLTRFAVGHGIVSPQE